MCKSDGMQLVKQENTKQENDASAATNSFVLKLWEKWAIVLFLQRF